MFYLEILKQAIDPSDQVTRSFVEQMVPAMMEQYAAKSAKGGDHSRDTKLDEQTKRKFEEKDDQSMVSHQLNGIFPTMRLLNLLEAEGIGPVPFSEVERRVYILSYLMHDVDKIVQIHGVQTRDREAIEQAKDLIAEQLRVPGRYHIPGSQYAAEMGYKSTYISLAFPVARETTIVIATPLYLF